MKAGLLIASVALFASCNQYAKMQKNANDIDAKASNEVLSLVGTTVATDVTVDFPAKYFEKGMILKVTPVLKYEGGEITGAPKYYQGEKVADNYTTVAKKTGGKYTDKVTIPYSDKAAVSTLEMRVEGRYAENKKAELTQFAEFASIPVAQGVSTVQSLSYPQMTVMPDNFKRVTTITEEADVHFTINSSAVRSAELRQDQIALFKEFVKENQNKEKVTLGNVYAKGYASPDGPEKFNDKLSAERSRAGEKAMKQQLKGTGVSYDAAAYGEDWEGFKQLVEASNMADKDLILQVLAMYDNSAKRDEEIKNLSKVFNELKESVLPQLRRTQFVVSADIEGKSDAELKEAALKGDRNLNVEEMLYAATLVSADKKASVYQLAADTYNDARAWNNLAIEKLNQGSVSAAKAAMDKAAKLASGATVSNNLAAVAIADGDIATAKRYLASINTADAKANKGLVALYEGDYAAAAKDLGNYNQAVAEVLNGNYTKAKSALGNANCGDSEYLRAVISMREGDSKGATAYLKSAIAKDPKLAQKAKKDVEFIRLFNTPEFKSLIK